MILRLFLVASMILTAASAATTPVKTTPADEALAAYFRAETTKLSERCLQDIKTLDDWNSRKEMYREQLFDMLGLWPLPPKTDLKPQVTGKVEHAQFTVENLHFQSRPGFYVTANFYIPKNVSGPVPTVLYVCGHAKVITNGVSLGNKTAYQHHGAWFARNGYACLIVDTVQLGEIEGIHHGTYRENMWWWNSRGYTPAGAEAWNNIRALDYLETRPEVDRQKIGVTGRSGGGAYSWTLTALDDRIKVAAPVAGITDLQNYVVDGAVEGHCDCMFMVNTYRWDYPLLAAMSAPRALMFGNSDKDRIFPLDGVQRTHAHIKDIYNLHQSSNKLALLITDGPHEDTQDLQLPVFRWFNRQLKGEDPVIEMAATNLLKPEQLKVFSELPGDQINSKVHEQFVPPATAPVVPKDAEEWMHLRTGWMLGLQQKVFAGWPESSIATKPERAFSKEHDGVEFSTYDFLSQSNVLLRMYVLRPTRVSPQRATLRVLDEQTWPRWLAVMQHGFATELATELQSARDSIADAPAFDNLRREITSQKQTLIYFAPRGIGLSAWSGDEKKKIQIRRRFMLLGQTLDSMRVWDIRRAIQTANELQRKIPITIEAANGMAVNAVYASIFEPAVDRLELNQLPKSHMVGPDYLNVLRVLDIPQALTIATEKRDIVMRSSPVDWAFATDVAARLNWTTKVQFVTE